MSERRSLAALTAELVGLAEPGDTESSHARADDVLIEAIRALSSSAKDRGSPNAEALIAAWRKVPKWYA